MSQNVPWQLRSRTFRRLSETAGLALLAYVPYLLSRPGRVSGDTKQYLYLNPGAFLARAPYLWDPHVGAGTVPHQNIGYLFPMGPWFWIFDRLGVPDWIAQRLWLGTITFAAALGTRWLLTMLGTRRAGALAGALVYALSPYQLAFTSGLSVLLLPWAGLPWLVGLTMRAVRQGGWRDPALFALVVLTVGGINASALVLAGLGPVLWLVSELFRGRSAARAALGAAARIVVLSVGVSIWWIVGLRLQGGYGLPVLRLTESLSTVADHSSPDDLLRGIGNWLLYTRDSFGSSIDQAVNYTSHGWVSVVSYAVPVSALVAAGLIRWRHRSYAVLLVVVGTIVGVGAWPYDHPSPYGTAWKGFAERSSVGLALRNSPRVVPVVILGLAALLAGAVGSLTSRRRELLAAGAVSLLAVGALGPVWQTGALTAGHDRPEHIPSYWFEAARAMDGGGDATRVLEMPGANFAAYRWGTAVEPVTPGLIHRPYLAREVLPYGSPPSVNLLDALDYRFQQGTFEPASLAPIARLFGVGTVSLRLDLQSDRFGLRDPQGLWDLLTALPAPGLQPPQGFGPPLPRAPSPALRTGSAAQPTPSVALLDVKDPVPIVRTAPVADPIVVAGDGDGVVDAAAAGLVDGRAMLFNLAALRRGELRRAMDRAADLILTDSNRRRAQHWFFSLQRNKGATEQAGVTAADPRHYDYRLDVFPGSTDDSRTIVEQLGGRVAATGDGGPARPEDRAVYAFDGDLRTSWRVGGEDPTGQRITVKTERPVTADHVTLVQPQEGPRDRVLTRVRLRFDSGQPVTADLGPASLTPAGQVVTFPARAVKRLEIELVTTTKPSGDPATANAVGFGEVRLGNVRVDETVRMPVDLAKRTGPGALGHGLDVIATRLRLDPADRGRQDEELRLDRRFVLANGRNFALSGVARINPNAGDDVLDDVLGTVAPGATFSATSHLQGELGARASQAFDGDRRTAWISARGPQAGQAVGVDLASPTTFGAIELTVVSDRWHSVPTRLHLEADGRRAGNLVMPATPSEAKDGTTTTVRLPVNPTTARRVRLVVDGVQRRTVVPGDPNPGEILPVAVAEVGFAGAPVAPAAVGDVPARCRTDLVEVDGAALAVRVVGPASDARAGLRLIPCQVARNLARGAHRVRSSIGLDTGIDVDRLLLSSAPGGRPSAIAPRGIRRTSAGATASVERSHATSMRLSVRTNGKPFWVVLGQSHNDGWAARASSGSLGPLQVVDGYANGWLVRPSRPGTMAIDLEWKPQRLVWAGFAVSALAILGCLAIVAAPLLLRRRASSSDLAAPASALAEEPALSPFASRTAPTSPVVVGGVVAAVTVLVVTAVSRPWIGLVSGAAALLIAFVPRARWLVALAVPVVLVISRVTDNSELAWLTLGLLLSDLAGSWPESRSKEHGRRPRGPRSVVAPPVRPAGAPSPP